MKLINIIVIINFYILLVSAQTVYAEDESKGYRWIMPEYDSRAIYDIDYDETGISNLFPDFSRISKLSNWTLNGQAKTIFVVYFLNELTFNFSKDKSEVLKACKKIQIDSSNINAFIYTYSQDGRITEKLEIHLANRYFSEEENKEDGIKNKIVINGITFTGYSSVDTVRTIYEYNKFNLIEKIYNEGKFEIRKYDEHNNLISREGGYTLNSYKTKNTLYKIEYKYSTGKIEIYTSSLLDIYPIKTKDIFLDSNLNISKLIKYNEFDRDTSSIISFTYDNNFRIKTVTENTLGYINGKLMVNYDSQYKTEYIYNPTGKLKEETSYSDTIPDIKFEYKYGSLGLLTSKSQYSSLNESNGIWDSDITHSYYYLSMDKMNNPMQIVDISGVMQFDKSFNYRMNEMHFINYEYYK